ncbi:zinc finger domain-containing protein [Actinomycetospora aeridis]|uniref:Uncharacterized protein n=1 Tax=Actinomycetospora aeridis TaxID=3129231 RepID=A0ABU8N154_9PSEU
MTDRELDMARVEAERHPCAYVLPEQLRPRAARKRAQRDGDDRAWRCGAQAGEPCRNLLTGQPLRHQAAHDVRLRDAGVELLPVPSHHLAD